MRPFENTPLQATADLAFTLLGKSWGVSGNLLAQWICFP